LKTLSSQDLLPEISKGIFDSQQEDNQRQLSFRKNRFKRQP